MRKLLDWLYPKYDEVTVFLMTLIIVVSIGGNAAARNEVEIFLTPIFQDSFAEGIFILFLILSSIAAGLMLPFTRRDLRGMAILVVCFHTLVVNVVNMAMLNDKSDPLWYFVNCIFAVYSFSWLLVLRFREEDAISERQAHPREALYCGAVCLVALFFAMVVFQLPWLMTYWFTFMGVPRLHHPGLSWMKAFKPASPGSQIRRQPAE